MKRLAAGDEQMEGGCLVEQQLDDRPQFADQVLRVVQDQKGWTGPQAKPLDGLRVEFRVRLSAKHFDDCRLNFPAGPKRVEGNEPDVRRPRQFQLSRNLQSEAGFPFAPESDHVNETVL